MDASPFAAVTCVSMGDVDLETLLEPHSKDLKVIAEAIAKGERDKVIDGAAGLAVALASGNPLLSALAPLARKGIAKAFGNAADEMFARELAKIEKEEERKAFLDQIDEVAAALVGQAIIQLVRTQHNVKDEILAVLGGVRADFETFRVDFESRVHASGESVIVVEQIVEGGAVGVRVRPTTTKGVHLRYQRVSGRGSAGIVLE
jgi:hypothetical protein